MKPRSIREPSQGSRNNPSRRGAGELASPEPHRGRVREPSQGSRDNRRGILAAGNFVIDYVAMVDHYPKEETIANVTSVTRANGGPAYNALVDLAHMGAPFPLEALGLVGDDDEGRFILRHCRELGIGTKLLQPVPGASTSYSDILTVGSTGKRTIIHHRGANALLDRRHFDFGKTRARVMLLAFLALLDRLDRPQQRYGTVAAQVLADARKAGIITAADVVSDASGRLPELVRHALPHLDYFFLNETEAELITGINVRATGGSIDRSRIERVARSLVEQKMRGWVVLHTAEGAAAVKAGEPLRWQGSVKMPATKVVGTNGAGDAFAAGFLYGVHEGVTIEESLRIASCVAAASITDGTPSAGVRPLRGCLRFGSQFGFRA